MTSTMAIIGSLLKTEEEHIFEQKKYMKTLKRQMWIVITALSLTSCIMIIIITPAKWNKYLPESSISLYGSLVSSNNSLGLLSQL